ncbi:non-hydrolyzing UDP-N-acetylglucosamine 2-epimerase [Winogradskyella schleiferi]|uniref:non-hydrolyzing UDP-N-acetylglucosamine 2-epimerase n=1 Tax=Winogradskyella schleiferi TaxID=2686078 RepID=UPI0015BBF05A|nr:UDP-N-acetylglucosamine 2-epimerase (non-hydrolyzing) [Winogradskyella schleiferi]
MIRLLIIVGTRPNYIKVTQFKKVAEQKFKNKFDIKIVHTGQHFDKAMADDFFKQLDIYPDFALNIPQSTANNQIGEIIIRLEGIVNQFLPDMIIVPGDVNSTLAAAITANKMNIPLAHLESGLRSFDRSMPEEINRLLVDEITDHFIVTEQSGIDNLLKEGKPKERIHFVGNTMIDTLVAFEEDIESQSILETFQLNKDDFILMTIHRPATVDHKNGLEKLLNLMDKLSKNHQVVFPMHPRTLNNLSKYGLKSDFEKLKGVIITGPLDYFSFQNLIHNCKMVLTDSGGIQEETTYKLKPCLTLRPNTERPSTITQGTNVLLDFDVDKILSHIETVEAGMENHSNVPKFWDGKATERILAIIETLPLK